MTGSDAVSISLPATHSDVVTLCNMQTVPSVCRWCIDIGRCMETIHVVMGALKMTDAGYEIRRRLRRR